MRRVCATDCSTRNERSLTASVLSVVWPPMVTFWYMGLPAVEKVCAWLRTLLTESVLIQRHVRSSRASSRVMAPEAMSAW